MQLDIKNIFNALIDGIIVLEDNGPVLFNDIGAELWERYGNTIPENLPVNINGKYYFPRKRSLPGGEVLIWRDVTEIEELKQIMVIDPETGVFNSRFMHTWLERELDRVSRSGSQMALVLIDVEIGDESNLTLREVAQVITQTVRAYDMVCRTDRADFAVMLFAIDPNSLNSTVERIFTAIRKAGVKRVSVGASLSGRSPSAESLLKQAQRALYVVNVRGGNDFSIY